MWTSILSIAGTILVPLLKWIFGGMANKKLSDKEFLEHIEAHQSKRAGAGKTATSFESSMTKAVNEAKKQKAVNAENKSIDSTAGPQ